MTFEEAILALYARLAEVERKQEGRIARGTVHEVDPDKGTVRLKVGGTDDEPFLTPPIPYAQTMGALKVHSPPSVGQQMTAFNDGGDYRQGLAIPMTQSDTNKSPSTKGDEHVMTLGSTTVRVKGDEVFVKNGEQEVHMKADGSMSLTSGKKLTIKASGVDIDAPVAMLKGFTAKGGVGGNSDVAGVIEGKIHVTNDITSNTKVSAPQLQGSLNNG
jgi:phage baseplate assembly protein gpV